MRPSHTLTLALLLAGCMAFAPLAATAQKLTTLYNFCSQGGSDCTDGSGPSGYLIQGSDGNFYGIAAGGGQYGQGTVFKMTASGTLTTLYNFCALGGADCTDGAVPEAGVIEGSDSNFYGMTAAGGIAGTYDNCGAPTPFTCGTIFKLTPSGELTTLYSFCSQIGVINGYNYCADGSEPSGGLVLGSDGNFYGTTAKGGSGGGPGNGIVFKLSPEPVGGCAAGSYAGNGYCETVLYNFCSQNGCGAGPTGLIEGSDSNFYGTTYSGFGVPGVDGTVYKITPSGNLTTLAYFGATGTGAAGAGPQPGLVEGRDGNFYGTTSLYGNTGGIGGAVFSATPAGVLTALHTFCSLPDCADGYGPNYGLIQASDGNFYGMTQWGGGGGQSECTLSGLYGCGTIFKITPDGTLSTLTTLHAFCSEGTWPTCADGELPNAGLVEATDFNFYGIAGGGVHANGDGSGGIVFALAALPVASVSPASLAFGNQGINGASTTKKVVLTSSGGVSVTNISVAITGANFADFTEVNNCHGTLKVGSKCTISVTFTPTLLAAESATLQVTDNGVNSPQSAALSGTGVADLTLTPTAESFGSVPQATSSAARNFTLKNNLSTALSISGISFSGANQGDFSRSGGTCGTSLSAKASCTISVTFTPSLVGAESATLSVTSNAQSPYNSLTSAVSGTGIAQATVSPASITYAKQKVGTTSSAHKVTLKNNLSTALVINGFSFTGSDPGDFNVSATSCGASLAMKSSCTLSVTFTPTATGKRTATLNVNDGASDSPQTVSLTGTGD